MYLTELVRKNGLKSADVIISKKIGWNVLAHTITYLGQDYYTDQELFVANMKDGIRVLDEWGIKQLLQQYKPVRLKRFKGTEYARQEAVKRALSKLGENRYHILFNNCEHFSNYVQHGRAFSKQSQNFGLAVAAFALLLLAFSGRNR